MGTTFENTNRVIITNNEYKQLILDGALQKEALQLENERRRYIKEVEDYRKKSSDLDDEYHKRFYELDELLENKHKSILDDYKNRLHKYESNWFVKLFLKK